MATTWANLNVGYNPYSQFSSVGSGSLKKMWQSGLVQEMAVDSSIVMTSAVPFIFDLFVILTIPMLVLALFHNIVLPVLRALIRW